MLLKPGRKKIISYLSSPEKDPELFSAADRVRKKNLGDGIHVRGIVEFSNFCSKDCLYCGIRAGNRKIKRYRMSDGEILASAHRARRAGIMTVVLQSGEDPHFSTSRLCGVVEKIKKETGLAVTLSVGEKRYREYIDLKRAGADRYLLRFETSDKNLFCAVKPSSSYGRRFECISMLRAAGFQVGSGILIGLPGQTIETLADDIMLFREMKLDMIGVGPFIPHPDTPLGNFPPGTIESVLRVVALSRLASPRSHIPATTAMGSIDSEGRQKALMCGANVIMPNIGPLRYRKYYSLYPGKICVNDGPSRCAACVDGIIASLGRERASGFGHSIMGVRDGKNA